MANKLYRLEIRRSKTHVTIRAVGRGPRGHNFTLGVQVVPLAEYDQFMAAGGMVDFLKPHAAARPKPG